MYLKFMCKYKLVRSVYLIPFKFLLAIDWLIIVVYLTSLCKLGLFWHECASLKFTNERVEYNVFLFDEPLKGSKSLIIFKISLTFCF
jgi:hypothetical protein